MDKVLEEARKLREDIDELPEIKEYLKLKQLIETDDELKKMRLEIARLKSLGKEEERNNLLNIYNNHPLVNNFEIAKEEAHSILLTIRNLIQ